MCQTRTLNEKLNTEINNILRKEPDMIRKILLERFRDHYFVKQKLSDMIIMREKGRKTLTRSDLTDII